MSENFEYVNQHYGVNACVGRRVVAYGCAGTITKDFGQYIGIVLDTAPHSAPERYHPTDGIEYGEVIDYEPPKINARQYQAKCNYQEFLDEDCSYEFHEWLGIEKPRMDYGHHGKFRMYRTGKAGYMSVYGEWCDTQKAAKASYKEALKKRQEDLRHEQ